MDVGTKLVQKEDFVNTPGLQIVPLMDPPLMNGFAGLSLTMMPTLKKLGEGLLLNLNL
jgi:hypothetical protein